MEKINIGTNVSPYPMPMALVGAMVGGRINFLTVAWLARVNYKPAIMAVAINRRHFTTPGIRENGVFSVNYPSADLIAETDYCGMVSGRVADKSDIFEVFYGELENAPMIKKCPLCLECRVIDTITLPSNELFLGEIIGAYTEEQYLTDGKPDIKKINPLLLSMPDNNYWTVGEHAGTPWEAGKQFKREKKIGGV
ncbi:MAG: flavin reductase family protein [Desulfobacca sp.]|nr:flavin reductase family protein [Desulfobacca sp.]